MISSTAYASTRAGAHLYRADVLCTHLARLSTVWRCVCKVSHRPLVLKQYHKSRMQPVHVEQVANEVAALSLFAGVRFTGAVNFHGTFDEGDGTFLVLEHCSGGSAFDHMRPLHPPSEAWLARQVVVPLLMTLDFAHRRGFVHCDVKPEHCLFTEDGAFRLADWGLAIRVPNRGLSAPMPVVGTLDYLAPEVLAVCWLRVTGFLCWPLHDMSPCISGAASTHRTP